MPQPAHRFPNGAREVTRLTTQRHLIVTVLALLLINATASAAEPRVHRDLPYAEPKNERQTLFVGERSQPETQGAITPGNAASATPQRKLRVVFFSAHPDDPLWGSGGLMILLSRGGHEVIAAYATCFRGDRKIDGEPENTVRRREAVGSSRVVGATVKFFDYAHESFVADADTLRAVSSWLEEVKPDLVVTHWPIDTHPNHHVAASLVWQCYKLSGGWNLYWYEVGEQTKAFRPDLYLDVESLLARKKEALECHRGSLQVISHPDPDRPWRLVEELQRRRGAECGIAHAEAFALVEAKAGCPLLPVPFLTKKIQ
ncbi:MAG: PIG-L family deacetylase [Verrucomicrobiales bacterium]|nr:PIG-L family deacetylase [Verrucomicrobiales bacterium]